MTGLAFTFIYKQSKKEGHFLCTQRQCAVKSSDPRFKCRFFALHLAVGTWDKTHILGMKIIVSKVVVRI